MSEVTEYSFEVDVAQLERALRERRPNEVARHYDDVGVMAEFERGPYVAGVGLTHDGRMVFSVSDRVKTEPGRDLSGRVNVIIENQAGTKHPYPLWGNIVNCVWLKKSDLGPAPYKVTVRPLN